MKLGAFSSRLVAEQPGARVAFFGFLLSLILGLSFRAFTSPVRIRDLLQQGLQGLPVRVEFQSAQISLRDGFFPEFALRIEGVKIQSDDKCIMKPEVFLSEIRFPISPWRVVTNHPPIHSVEVEKAQVYFNDRWEKCDSKWIQRPAFPYDGSAQNENLAKEASSFDLDQIHIEEMEVFHPLFMQTPLQTSRIHIQRAQDQLAELRARIHLFRDEKIGRFLSYANLILTYTPKGPLEFHLYGNWREGYYSLVSHCDFIEGFCKLESQAKEIPANLILEALRRHVRETPDIELKGQWLSFDAKSHLDLKHIESSTLDLVRLKIEGELGAMILERCHFWQIQPLSWEPCPIKLSRVNLDSLLRNAFLSGPQKNKDAAPIFNHVESSGVLDGLLEFIQSDEVRLIGQITQAGLIFSSKGERRTQWIDNMNVQFRFVDGIWRTELDHILFRDGLFQGGIEVLGDPKSHLIQLQMEVHELRLAENIQKLITNEGQISPAYLKLRVNYRDGDLQDLQGQMQIPQVRAENLNFKKLDLRAQKNEKELQLQLQIPELEIFPESEAMKFLSPLAMGDPSEVWRLRQLRSKFEVNEAGEFFWNEISVRTQNKGHFKSQGGWNSLGQLSGKVEQTNKGSLKKVWQIRGTRDKAELVDGL